MYSEKKYLHHQYTVTTDWPGGVYGSVAVQGSRAGGTIAATWATLVSMGEDGYTEATKSIVDTAKYIENGLRKMKGIFVYGTPVTTVVAIGSKDFDIYRLSGNLAKLGWALNALQFPPGIHICVTYMQAQPGVADQFLNDVKNEVAECMKNPEVPPEGKVGFIVNNLIFFFYKIFEIFRWQFMDLHKVYQIDHLLEILHAVSWTLFILLQRNKYIFFIKHHL